MLGVHVVNLLIPGDPANLTISTPTGMWTLTQEPFFSQSKIAMGNAQCAHTYILEHPASLAINSHLVTQALDELTPLLLASAFATGLSVTAKISTSGSDIKIIQPTQHWPRERTLDKGSPVVSSVQDFKSLVEGIVPIWSTTGKFEKALLLFHHWLDSLGCWSMEDLYLSATTLLQIIAATEERRQSRSFTFFSGITSAAQTMNIRVLTQDFKNMRNELVHDGQLIGSRFVGPDRAACAAVLADVLNWFDEYVYAAFVLGAPHRTRFSAADFKNLNSYSI